VLTFHFERRLVREQTIERAIEAILVDLLLGAAG
jgi:hypothetical protein